MTRPQPLVFDHTAIIALFRGHRKAFGHYNRADVGQVFLVLPAAAVAEANLTIHGVWKTWEALLYPEAVTVAPLDEHSALEAGLLGDIAIGHAMYEARAVRGLVVTSNPDPYRHTDQALLVI